MEMNVTGVPSTHLACSSYPTKTLLGASLEQFEHFSRSTPFGLGALSAVVDLNLFLPRRTQLSKFSKFSGMICNEPSSGSPARDGPFASEPGRSTCFSRYHDPVPLNPRTVFSPVASSILFKHSPLVTQGPNDVHLHFYPQ
jgi:hypothetical protein